MKYNCDRCQKSITKNQIEYIDPINKILLCPLCCEQILGKWGKNKNKHLNELDKAIQDKTND